MLVLIITAVVFSGTLKLGWTNWDDDLYIYENHLVKEGMLKEIFMPPANPADNNTYSPLVISSFALEWKLGKGNPFLYHLDNLILHLLCTALVWFFFRALGLSVWWSGFAALLFGIHPMRVESVAWITERKDLFYAFFCLASLLAYLRYLASEKTLPLLLAFIFFVLSLCSKVQAITLPFVLILLDWYFRRKIDLKAILEKVFFFAGSLTIGVSFLVGVNFLMNKAGVITFDKIISFLIQIVLGIYAYTVYLFKLFVPYPTSPLYPPPASLQAWYWLVAAIAFIVLIGALAVRRNYRYVTFGMLFFTFNILLIPFASAVGDSTFINDRYTYVAYIGLFFIVAMVMQELSEKYPSSGVSIKVVAVILLAVFSALTIKYIPVWKNSETLWSHVIKKYPHRIPIAYLNRGHFFYNHNQSGRALEDFNTAIEINPHYLQAYMNRGLIYLKVNDFENALKDYNSILDLMRPYDTSGNVLNPAVSDALGNRGLIYSGMGQYEKALNDLDLAVKLNPANPVNYLNRAFVYHKLGRIGEARADVLAAEKMGAAADPVSRELLKR